MALVFTSCCLIKLARDAIVRAPFSAGGHTMLLWSQYRHSNFPPTCPPMVSCGVPDVAQYSCWLHLKAFGGKQVWPTALVPSKPGKVHSSPSCTGSQGSRTVIRCRL